MSDNSTVLQDVSAIVRRERRLSWLFTVVSITVVAGILAFIFYSSSVLNDNYAQLAQVAADLDDTTARLEESQAELESTERELAENRAALATLSDERDSAEVETELLRGVVAKLSEDA